VIENEYGEDVGVESLVAKDGAAGGVVEDFFELSNGCLCCTVRDDLVETLERVMERRDRYDYVIVETTGMANPGPVATAFWQDEALESAMQLDGIVAVADCKHLAAQLGRMRADGGVNEAQRQLAHADVVLLNKTDLVDEAGVAAASRLVASVNATCRVVETVRGRVDLDRILHIGSFDAARLTAQLGHAHDHAHDEDGGGGKDGHRHEHGRQGDDEVQTVVVRLDATALDERLLTRFIGGLVWVDEGAPAPERPTTVVATRRTEAAAAAGNDDDGPGGGAPAASLAAADGLEDDDDDDEPPELAEATEEDAVAAAASSASSSAAATAASSSRMHILRIKGVLAVRAAGGGVDPRMHVLQGVEDVFEVAASSSPWPEGAEPGCRVLFIGRRLEADRLREGLRACAV